MLTGVLAFHVWGDIPLVDTPYCTGHIRTMIRAAASCRLMKFSPKIHNHLVF